MSASRKDFELIAKGFRASMPLEEHSGEHYRLVRYQWMNDVKHMTYALREMNPRFDEERFLNACGYYDQA